MSMWLTDGRLPNGRAVDVLLHDGLIKQIVPAASGVRANFEVLDVGGRYLIPGLWDNHVHFNQWAMASRRVDVSSATSAAQTAVLVGGHLRADLAAGAQTAGQLVGFGFRDGLWADEPTKTLLDAVSGAVPVVLISADLHSCWLNSAALARHGFAGHPTGLLREDDCFRVTGELESVPVALLDAWADEAAKKAAARGVVGVIDLEMDWNLDAWVRRIAGGVTSLRVEFGIYTRHLERAVADGLRTGDTIEGTHGLLRVGPYKVITDGSLNTRTAYCFDAYPGFEGEHSHGIHTVPLEELVSHMRLAWGNGIRPHVHAIGDRANTIALDAFEQVGCPGAIEHAQLLRDEDVPRFAQLGVVASVQPEHAMDDRDVTDVYWAGRTQRAFAIASLARAGARLSFGSDAPVAPLDPWVTMSAAVGRARDGREPWHPEQAISAAQALAASTRSPDGQLRVGEPADIAVVELDPVAVAAEQLRTMPVAATLLGGRPTWNAL